MEYMHSPNLAHYRPNNAISSFNLIFDRRHGELSNSGIFFFGYCYDSDGKYKKMNKADDSKLRHGIR